MKINDYDSDPLMKVFEELTEEKEFSKTEQDNESHTPALDRAKNAHCRATIMIGKQCLVCGHSKIIENRPAYVVCDKLQMEMPGNYTCDKFDRYGQESE